MARDRASKQAPKEDGPKKGRRRQVRPDDDAGRYGNRLNGWIRQGAQMLLLKPVVWALCDIEVHGLSHLSGVSGPFVVVGNHSSHLDTPLIFGSLPRRLAQYMATGAAADFFFNKWWKQAPMSVFFNAFPVVRSRKSPHQADVRQSAERPQKRIQQRGQHGMARQLLGQGVPLLIFPEGTRSYTGAMGPWQPGVAALCISQNVPAIPVALVGAYAAWPHSQSHPPVGHPSIHVVYGPPMMPKPGEIAHQFNERVRRKVIELHDQTAMAYGMRTLAEYARVIAIEKAKVGDPTPLNRAAKRRGEPSGPLES